MKKDAEMRKKERLAQKYDTIIDIAENIINKKGFSNFTLEDIASEMNITKNALYHYFNSRISIIYSIGIRGYKKLIEMFTQTIEKNKLKKGITVISELGFTYFKFTLQYPNYRAVFHEMAPKLNEDVDPRLLKELNKLEQKFVSIWIGAIQLGIQDKSIRYDIQPALLAILLGSLMSGLIDELSHRKELLDLIGTNIEIIIKLSLDILSKGLKSS